MTDRLKTDAQPGCSVNEIAEALGLTPRRIQQMVGASILPRPQERGKYDLLACTKAYAKHQRKELRRSSAKNGKKKSFWSGVKGWNSAPKKTSEEISLDIEAMKASIEEMLRKRKKKAG